MADSKNHKELEKLVELSIAFRNAVENLCERNPDVLTSAIVSLTEEETDNLLFASMGLEFYGSAPENDDEEFLKLNLEFIDAIASIAGRVLSRDELADLLPDDLVSEEKTQELAANNAKSIATLCRHKLSL